jgi:perosamine synthetase
VTALEHSRAREPGALAGAGEIPLCAPFIEPAAWTYLKDCLDTGWVSSVGQYVNRFEGALAEVTGMPHAVAVTTGTAALHVALQLAGVGREDQVLVSTLSFIAPANAIRYLGAWPVFIDAEPRYWQMSPESVERYLRERCRREDDAVVDCQTGRRVRAILPVHILGHPVDADPILALAREFGLSVVEDATEGLRAAYKGRPVGSLGDVACLSFNGNKLLTTGGGGMILTRNADWAARARYLTTQAKDDPIEFVHGAVGFNYRLTNIQAALGCAQAEALEEHVAAKRRIAARYAEALSDVPGITLMPEAPWAESVFWLYTILVDSAGFGVDSRALLGRLAAAGIQSRPLWQPLHRSPAHAAGPEYHCPVADNLNARALSLPCSVGLTDEEQDRVIRVIRNR